MGILPVALVHAYADLQGSRGESAECMWDLGGCVQEGGEKLTSLMEDAKKVPQLVHWLPVSMH